MNELALYKKAYATLMGRVDGVADRLMAAAAKPEDREELMLIALELLFSLHEAENTFLNEEE